MAWGSALGLQKRLPSKAGEQAREKEGPPSQYDRYGRDVTLPQIPGHTVPLPWPGKCRACAAFPTKSIGPEPLRHPVLFAQVRYALPEPA
eukprot:CAMPEP_0181229468 /NCGR_PEP_ID=MMETSP1096-20121128/33911_1 /TAXON_ID=156174 ORGANISM="Chrysochromulina ericina, Strain CCMP281" /NCGR_SAMPLE_ID=MMETSP1096 /ASSEMBLY_ACC=CAM_ASM_000453 /LENGTH=89 /DNA_ID=CAMNT_0023323089 /DNA_START=286 /DNA_END=556 /DNA_ORIENTATION=-